MVPDQKLSGLLSEVCRLPEKIDKSPDQHFVPEINSKGLHGTLHVFSHDEALIVALLSLREQSFHQIFNRFKTRTMERKQNRAMAFAPTWLIEIIHDRLVERKILNPLFFKKEYIPYSSVWIDSNTSWKESGQKKPTEVCGQQGVLVFCFADLFCFDKCVYRSIQIPSEILMNKLKIGIINFCPL